MATTCGPAPCWRIPDHPAGDGEAQTGAHSTDLEAPESAEHLCEKCKAYAACWQPTAEQLWDEEHRQ